MPKKVEVLMMMKAAKLEWAGAGQEQDIEVGQNQGKSRAGQGMITENA